MEYIPYIHKIDKIKKKEKFIPLFIEEFIIEPKKDKDDEKENNVIILQL